MCAEWVIHICSYRGALKDKAERLHVSFTFRLRVFHWESVFCTRQLDFKNQKPCICSTYLTGGCRGYPGPDTVSGKNWMCTHWIYGYGGKKRGATNNTLLIRWIVTNVCILALNIKKWCCTDCLPWATTDLLDPFAPSTTQFSFLFFFFSFYL